MSKSTEDANEIGFHTATGPSWQFELNGVGGPVTASYVDAVENCAREGRCQRAGKARGWGDAYPAAEHGEVEEADGGVHELVALPEGDHAVAEDAPGGRDDHGNHE
jgi:hypothetical protein